MNSKESERIIDRKIDIKVMVLYKEAMSYTLITYLLCFFICIYIDVPMHYYMYLLWHFLGLILVVVLYEDKPEKRVNFVLIKYFISGVAMFYLESKGIIAYVDVFLFLIVLTMNFKRKCIIILGFLFNFILLFKWVLVGLGYLENSYENSYTYFFVYLFTFSSVGLFYVITNNIRKFVVDNLTELESHVDDLHKLAYYDRLTGIENEEFFIKELDELVLTNPKSVSIIVFNIKNIRAINISYGESIGDKVFVEIANILNSIKSNGEIVARLNGNEFAMLAYDDATQNRASEVLEILKREFSFDAINTEVEYYVGAASYDANYETGRDWLHNALVTISYLKRNNIVKLAYYDKELEKTIIREEKISYELKRELANGGFSLYFQGKVDANSGTTVGVEALARWQSKTFGAVSPYYFVPIIQRLDLSREFGKLIIRKAIASYDGLVKKYGKGISLSINISPMHVMSQGFKKELDEVLKEFGVSPKNITLEITEDVLIDGIEKVNEIFESLREMGVRISLDDFGTGYSSLNYLLSLSIDELKIDKTFIDSLTTSPRTEELLNFLIDLSNIYNLDIVCEGVETDEQCEKLLNLGCPVIQGYYFSKPVPLD